MKLNFQQSIIIESLTRGKRYNSRKNKPVQRIEGTGKKRRHFDVLMAKHASFITQFIAAQPSESWRGTVSHISSIRKPTPSSKIIISTAERGCVHEGTDRWSVISHNTEWWKWITGTRYPKYSSRAIHCQRRMQSEPRSKMTFLLRNSWQKHVKGNEWMRRRTVPRPYWWLRQPRFCSPGWSDFCNVSVSAAWSAACWHPSSRNEGTGEKNGKTKVW